MKIFDFLVSDFKKSRRATEDGIFETDYKAIQLIAN